MSIEERTRVLSKLLEARGFASAWVTGSLQPNISGFDCLVDLLDSRGCSNGTFCLGDQALSFTRRSRMMQQIIMNTARSRRCSVSEVAAMAVVDLDTSEVEACVDCGFWLKSRPNHVDLSSFESMAVELDLAGVKWK